MSDRRLTLITRSMRRIEVLSVISACVGTVAGLVPAALAYALTDSGFLAGALFGCVSTQAIRWVARCLVRRVLS